ncbi:MULTISPECIES: lantibiotic immunity ABC transporter MutG family permease subunit [Alkalihalobacterium]|uniref:Lantibiotic immunity ABC transporter MutG family permease subunit n=1 Tax=Alkalihalobacterium chitinilyticum TaxID=2980103 RepID=A0ABT5VM04_9BACI|nr:MULTISPECIES: lantibiotic immunity ABC transporter MutG family permease subunit [Alkalihalobacterium]MDE5415304.1 lantibiotic immunity ABC transporter MutG family permease subunit [Alkalihalobacterium chitinilyticum]
MLEFIRCFLAEFKKRKRSLFLVLHLIVPLSLSGALIVYMLGRSDTLSAAASYKIFFELIGVGTPVIIAIICGMVADSEGDAGNFQNMIGRTRSKIVTFISQISMMLVSYWFAILLTITIYVFGIQYMVGIEGIDFTVFLWAGLIFSLTVVFQYFFYHMIAYKHGVGITSIFGFAGLIIAALAMTTIGDNIWPYLPWAWGDRFIEQLIVIPQLNGIVISDQFNLVVRGSITAFLLTTMIILWSMVWFNRWSNRKTID